MSTYQTLIEMMWDNYITLNPQAKRIEDFLTDQGEKVVYDHLAIRTFDHPTTSIEQVAKPFIAQGYQVKEDYHCPINRLQARHFEHCSDPGAPKIFISELQTKSFSPDLQAVVQRCIDRVNTSAELISSGVPWEPISYKQYLRLWDESEYAAWVYAFGFVPAHFTVSVNQLQHYTSLEAIHELIEANQLCINRSQGAIKGSPERGIEQSSTTASTAYIDFIEGVYEVSSGYYKFAKRYPVTQVANNGFMFTSKDTVFETMIEDI